MTESIRRPEGEDMPTLLPLGQCHNTFTVPMQGPLGPRALRSEVSAVSQARTELTMLPSTLQLVSGIRGELEMDPADVACPRLSRE